MRVSNRINKWFLENQSCDAYHINCGHCYHWCYIAYRIYGGSLWYNWGHAFLKLNGKFYDSESLYGVKDLFSLKANKSPRYSSKRSNTIKEFKEYWDVRGAFGWNQKLVDKALKDLR